MKYSKTNQPLVCMMTNSTNYKETSQMEIKGILWHSTGANNPNLKRYVQPSKNDKNYQSLITKLGKNTNNNDLNHIDADKGVNAWIGKLTDGTITTVQTLPWNYRPYGCGKGSEGSCNKGWIQFEICEDNLADPNYFAKVYKEACELTAYLCTLYNINPNGSVKYAGKSKTITVPTILCHQDSYKLGLGSGHADVYHWFKKYGKDMTTVRKDVAALMQPNKEEEEMTQEQFNKMMDAYLAQLAAKSASWEQEALNWAQNKGLINGNAKGQLMPKSFMTRGEFVEVLKRYDEQKDK